MHVPGEHAWRHTVGESITLTPAREVVMFYILRDVIHEAVSVC